jgi:hypothetical protein
MATVGAVAGGALGVAGARVSEGGSETARIRHAGWRCGRRIEPAQAVNVVGAGSPRTGRLIVGVHQRVRVSGTAAKLTRGVFADTIVSKTK